MNRPDYLKKYLFDWDLFDVVVGGKSALDTKFFMGRLYDEDRVNNFLRGYGLDPNDPVNRAELFGNFQEAMQFIRRYFLKEGNPDGLDLKIPNSLYMLTDIGDLILLATGGLEEDSSFDEKLWAEIILKVMHTILHADKDLRSNYFPVIQTQIFDRFYKHISRQGDQLYLGNSESNNKIRLVSFETKALKTRDSTIIKLLHKAENVAEELFDRIGVRFITETRFDTLRVVNHLIANNIVIPHNIKPSRSVNTMVNLTDFKRRYVASIKTAMRKDYSEEQFITLLEQEVQACAFGKGGPTDRNLHTKGGYQSLQFTCRQLVKYKNPFMSEFTQLRKAAKKVSDENDLAQKILSMDVSLIARDIRFFYPYEVQIVDVEAHKVNTEGEASHAEYKKAQTLSAMRRVFAPMIEFKKINFDK
ncbi:MAG: hypothetical protein COW01_01055 [Bdellovibrionales bacterium CG12_big_fil_rev_8_21_14_0_65_38_15]|nr:MAG: hypothetical protein COW79_05315 [Bdellovibrionales bacterium CG22_combo_CG10-13_8_21_14_all_38_13]PIQ57345.1 MAG: hypothetical protein COW01_01055 [Bdellovibrionales bacterium CG12_big_fil_rev_8_21_14_0_65_38_15]PIR28890.1 MAG: hypothetical protein COV38_13645 [Bdellovibrionales bacterium CG11_big_fil_rev_8_21_14_0_20_38_13]